MALKKQAPQDLVALAMLYYSTQVVWQARGTEAARRRDISRFLAFYYDLFRHYHPRDWHAAVTQSFVKSLLEDKRLAQATVCRVYASVRHFARWAHKSMNTLEHRHRMPFIIRVTLQTQLPDKALPACAG